MLTQTDKGTPMGELFRRFWLPALLADELPGPDCTPVRVTLLGEKLVAFRDTDGRVGFVDAYCPHRTRRCSSGATRNAACAASTTAGSSTSTATASTCRTASRAALSRIG
ncbi:hypothetical protein BJF78_03770 [Pseudonocardia sp. CNS-139]|nr:hypothetical protein BJF78_03770 [Pseudonocardia sp. CNS-139]